MHSHSPTLTGHGTREIVGRQRPHSSAPAVLGLASALALAGPLFAQTAPDSEADTVELSQFVVTAGDVDGYRATSTLAGTRIKTDLRDIATSISVVTEEFLRDTRSTNLQDLLVYTTGTEIVGIGGNWTNPGGTVAGGGIEDTSFKSPNQNTRLRGLASADLTRDYFSTSVGFDSYNTEAVTINRGANAVLFGLGSPAGIIDTALKQPIFANRAEVETQFGSYGTQRNVVDVERVLVDRKLSLRVAGLYSDRKYEMDPAFERDRRLYGTLAYRPFSGTTIRVSAESGDIDANRPRLIPPQNSVSYWFDPAPTIAGGTKLSHNPNSAYGLNELDNGTPLAFYFGPHASTNPFTVFFDQPNLASVDASANPGGVDGRSNLIAPNMHARYPAFITLRGTSQARRAYGLPADEAAYYTNGVVTDQSVFDYRKQLIDGPNKQEWQDFDAIDLSIEQLFLNGNAGVEIAHHEESSSLGNSSLLGLGSRYAAVQIDVNSEVVGGPWNTALGRPSTPNPNFGRPFVSFNGGETAEIDVDRSDSRLTSYLQTNLSDRWGWLGKTLGRQRFTGLVERNEVNTRTANSVNYAWGPEAAAYLNQSNNILGGPRSFSGIVYLGESLANASTAAGAHISNLKKRLTFADSYRVNVYDVDGIRPEDGGRGSYVDATLGLERDVPSAGSLSRIATDSAALVAQEYFWQDTVVATAGWRWDSVEAFQNNTPPRALDNRVILDRDSFRLPNKPSTKADADTFTWGLVAHLPRAWRDRLPAGLNLSLHYTEAENSRTAEARRTLFGDAIAPPSGVTTEKGVTLSALNNAIVLRVNRYKTQQANESVQGFTSFLNSIISIENSLLADPESIIAANPRHQADIAKLRDYTPFPEEILRAWNVTRVDPRTQNITAPAGLTATSDLVSEGWEYELFSNLTRNWTATLNASQTEVTRTNTAPEFTRYLELRAPVWAEFGHLPVAVDGEETIKQRLDRFAISPALAVIRQDGSKIANEVREWRLNVVTNYQFDNASRLHGWNVGGALRWQDKVGVGFPITHDPVLGTVPDISRPIYGPTETTVDAWLGYRFRIREGITWTIRLNVRNLLNNDNLIPVRADPDGSYPVVSIPETRNWTLSNTISF